ncbi:MAG: DUF4422 domain-containing protein [Eubacteriales bacterium]|nr:DUF4422 domain-containing protein [Eubacteriales bacterium]
MINIYVVCHKKAIVPDNGCLKPVQVGTALADSCLEGMEYDDGITDNISDKNRSYCELTAQYYAWKKLCTKENKDNMKLPVDTVSGKGGVDNALIKPQACAPHNTLQGVQQDTPDYIGFFHYRRYLSFSKIIEPEPDGALSPEDRRICPEIDLDSVTEDLARYGFSEPHMSEVIRQHDVITVLRERINTTVYRQYCQFHEEQTLRSVIRIMMEQHPGYEDAAREYLNSKQVYYFNMFIMKREIFEEYAAWLFGILFEYEKTEEYKTAVQKDPRLMGFLAERLFGIYYTHLLKAGVKAAELQCLRFYHTDPDRTVEEEIQSTCIRRFTCKPLPVTIRLDMRRFNRLLPPGSRRRLFFRSLMYR